MNDLQRAAARARPALAVLTAELGEPSPDAARALIVLGQMLDDIEAGRHPLDRPDDWPQRDRWPDRPHWDRWRWAIKTLAVASGTTAYCSPKYEYMRVDTRQARSDALTVALLDVAEVIELASVREPSGTIDSFLGLCAGRTIPTLTSGAMSTARDIERAILARCLQIATTPGDAPRDQAEANVCRLAGMIVDGRYPEAGARLFDAATRYFADRPEQQVASAEVVRRGWIISAPRLRERLERLIAGEFGREDKA